VAPGDDAGDTAAGWAAAADEECIDRRLLLLVHLNHPALPLLLPLLPLLLLLLVLPMLAGRASSAEGPPRGGDTTWALVRMWAEVGEAAYRNPEPELALPLLVD